jgi:hypothetical protein
MFTFLFDCDAKRKVNRKEKHAKTQYRLRWHKTVYTVICVFVYRQKSLSAPEDNCAYLNNDLYEVSNHCLRHDNKAGSVWTIVSYPACMWSKYKWLANGVQVVVLRHFCHQKCPCQEDPAEQHLLYSYINNIFYVTNCLTCTAMTIKPLRG